LATSAAAAAQQFGHFCASAVTRALDCGETAGWWDSAHVQGVMLWHALCVMLADSH
jgi:hypothetical protein